jgi:hypothetical protein
LVQIWQKLAQDQERLAYPKKSRRFQTNLKVETMGDRWMNFGLTLNDPNRNWYRVDGAVLQSLQFACNNAEPGFESR